MRFLKLIFAVILLTSCEEIIEVVDISDETVVLIAPVDDAVINTGSPSFSWQAVKDAEQYNIQIASPTFNEATQVVLDSLVSTTNFIQVLAEGNYEWRVKAVNSGYETDYVTTGFSITPEATVDISNETVTLLTPANNVTLQEGNVVFSWDIVANADEYTIQIVHPNFASAVTPIANTTVTATSFTALNMTANEYEWRVSASNLISETEYTTQSFTVEE
ncbi:hypothetical protein [Winogradskyella sp.]|uniref:hypothetical protein n=1 Tax=Winogradskyella sp. TaxID=1883156 RepID=UPI00262C285E|nr:hypothetical protein [Winogradskyella sp.]